jgi:hypothetical protein
VGAFKTIVSKARMMSGRGCDEADALGQLARAEEGGVVAASREGGGDGDLAFGRRKERWVGRSWAGEGGKMDQASREFGPKPIWAT